MLVTNARFIKMLRTVTTGAEKSTAYSEVSGSEFDAYIEKMSAYERSAESRRKYSASHTLICEVNISLSRNERIKDTSSGTYYDIVDIDNALMNHHQEIELREVTN